MVHYHQHLNQLIIQHTTDDYIEYSDNGENEYKYGDQIINITHFKVINNETNYHIFNTNDTTDY